MRLQNGYAVMDYIGWKFLVDHSPVVHAGLHRLQKNQVPFCVHLQIMSLS